MRKLVALFAFAAMVGCSDDDDFTTVSQQVQNALAQFRADKPSFQEPLLKREDLHLICSSFYLPSNDFFILLLHQSLPLRSLQNPSLDREGAQPPTLH